MQPEVCLDAEPGVTAVSAGEGLALRVGERSVHGVAVVPGTLQYVILMGNTYGYHLTV